MNSLKSASDKGLGEEVVSWYKHTKNGTKELKVHALAGTDYSKCLSIVLKPLFRSNTSHILPTAIVDRHHHV